MHFGFVTIGCVHSIILLVCANLVFGAFTVFVYLKNSSNNFSY